MAQTQQVAPTRTVAVELDARENQWQVAAGLTVPGYAFNGQIPGPTIEASAGDTVVVPTPEFAARTDDHPLARAACPGGDGRHRDGPASGAAGRDLRVPLRRSRRRDLLVSPAYQRDRAAREGPVRRIRVLDPADPAVDRDRVLVLDDLKLDRAGHLAAFGGRKERHDGRRGDVWLVNGAVAPNLEIAADQVERWRFVNASSSRYACLSIGGRTFSIIGTDGGLIGAPVEEQQVLLTPGERIDVAVGPFAQGEVITIDAVAYSRGMIAEEAGTYASVRVRPSRSSRSPTFPRRCVTSSRS